jgi:hypothetical protein
VLDEFVAQLDGFRAERSSRCLSQSGCSERNIRPGVRCPLEFSADCAEVVKAALGGHKFQSFDIVVLRNFSVARVIPDVKTSIGKIIFGHWLHIKTRFGRVL